MGYQDRDYYREQEPPRGSGVQSVVVKLIIINGALYLVNMFFGGGWGEDKITRALALRSDAIANPWMWYQFLTAGFVHAPENLLHIVGNMLGLYVFGTPLEQRFGAKEFLRFYLVAIVVSLLTWGVRNYFFVDHPPGFCMGASGGVTAAIILFCLLEPRATLMLFGAVPMPAWLFGILVVATDVFGSQPAMLGQRVAHDAHLAGAVFALAYWYFGINFGRLPGVSQLGRLLAAPQKWMRPKPPLKVHDPEQYYEDLDDEADRLLQKVSREGMESLTPKERQLLEDYSRRTRQKLR
jgi:membrane associated rhomboid family serine protease